MYVPCHLHPFCETVLTVTAAWADEVLKAAGKYQGYGIVRMVNDYDRLFAIDKNAEATGQRTKGSNWSTARRRGQGHFPVSFDCFAARTTHTSLNPSRPSESSRRSSRTVLMTSRSGPLPVTSRSACPTRHSKRARRLPSRLAALAKSAHTRACCPIPHSPQ
jgi:hypothetical protein